MSRIILRGGQRERFLSSSTFRWANFFGPAKKVLDRKAIRSYKCAVAFQQMRKRISRRTTDSNVSDPEQ
jgi:hypothetical protein